MAWDDVPMAARRLYRWSRKNALTRGIEFDLSQAEFEMLWSRAAGMCALTGFPFTATQGGSAKWHRNPWGASLDRIDSKEKYELNNCRLICACVNIAMNEWGAEVLLKMAQGLLGLTASTHPAARHGTGLPRGISCIRRNGWKPVYRVRIFVDGKLKDCGCRPTLLEAIALLESNKSTRTLAGQMSDLQSTGANVSHPVLVHL